MSQLSHEIIKRIIGIEGGYVNDARDSGGETKWGITLATARSYGYNVRTLTPEQAIDIYERGFWQKMELDGVASLSAALAEELFDSGVNVGTTTAVKWLQRALNVLNNNGTHWPDLKVDGEIGNRTLEALDAFFRRRGSRADNVLLNMLNGLQAEYYLALAERRPKDEAFEYGWQANRVGSVNVSNPAQMFDSPSPIEPVRSASAPQKKGFNPLDWLPGWKTHLVALTSVALSVAELLGYTVPAPVYGILASLGVSTAYRGLTRPI